jgi:hypothetical protein
MKSNSVWKIKGKVFLVDGCLREGNVAKARGTMLGWVRARKNSFCAQAGKELREQQVFSRPWKVVTLLRYQPPPA